MNIVSTRTSISLEQPHSFCPPVLRAQGCIGGDDHIILRQGVGIQVLIPTVVHYHIQLTLACHLHAKLDTESVMSLPNIQHGTQLLQLCVMREYTQARGHP